VVKYLKSQMALEGRSIEDIQDIESEEISRNSSSESDQS
jgi:hypothetical protein